MSLLKKKSGKKKKVVKAPQVEKSADGTTPAAEGSEAPAKPAKSKKVKKAKVKGEKKSAKPKKAKGEKKPRVKREGELSAIEAAEQVFHKNGNKPLSAKGLIEAMEKKGLWKSPGGKTPDRSLNSSLIREIAANGKKSKFIKVDRGQYQLRG